MSRRRYNRDKDREDWVRLERQIRGWDPWEIAEARDAAKEVSRMQWIYPEVENVQSCR